MEPKLRINIFFILISLFLTITAMAYLRNIAIPNGSEVGVDGFYHLKMADYFPDICISKTFPWTQLSVWKNNFFDKELGFHALVAYLKILDKSYLRSIEQAPYHFVSISIAFIMLLSIIMLFFYKLKIYLSVIIPLIVFSCPLFYLRINMIRPHMISIALFMSVTALLISKLKSNYKYIIIFLLCWLYTLFYSVPHIVLIPVIVYFFVTFAFKVLIGNKSSIKLPLVLCVISVLGILSGLTFHPQFPNSFYCWYIQGILVIKQILGLMPGKVWIGTELISPNTQTIYDNFLLILYCLFNLVLFILFKKTRKMESAFLIFLSIFLTAGFFISERFIEYALPVNLILLAYLISMLSLKTKIWKQLLFEVVFLSIVCSTMLKVDLSYLKDSKMRACYGFAKWSKNRIKSGTYIGQIRWGEFPRLFYASPHFFYSMAMDPMFSYYVYPNKTSALEMFRMLKKPLKPAQLEQILMTKFVFISKYDSIPANYLIAEGAEIIYHGDDGWLLKLTY